MKLGSFDAHFDELVKHFAPDGAKDRKAPANSPDRKEGRDIHALLFERAWRIGGPDDRGQ